MDQVQELVYKTNLEYPKEFKIRAQRRRYGSAPGDPPPMPKPLKVGDFVSLPLWQATEDESAPTTSYQVISLNEETMEVELLSPGFRHGCVDDPPLPSKIRPGNEIVYDGSNQINSENEALKAIVIMEPQNKKEHIAQLRRIQQVACDTANALEAEVSNNVN